MKNQTTIYYVFCEKDNCSCKEYKIFQRELADKILAHGFQEQFGVTFTRELVKMGVHGKPYWAGADQIYFNISNTKGAVVCALSEQEVGIDVECKRKTSISLLRKCCEDTELRYILGKEYDSSQKEAFEMEIMQERFVQLWTLKESYLKMTGEGMYFPIRDVVFSIEQSAQGTEITCNQPGIFVQNHFGEYWISLCMQKNASVLWQELSFETL